jgi:hypothetical protein
MFKSEQFDHDTALKAALALEKTLARRTHVKLVNGIERVVPGTLGEAIGLPGMISRLQSRSSRQRDQGLEDFRILWATLSPRTTRRVLDAIGWYEPKDLEWDDPRSNRRPDL